MGYVKMEQGKGPPSICWECGKRLMRVGRRSSVFYYRTVADPSGAAHRVHGDCYEAAATSGRAAGAKAG